MIALRRPWTGLALALLASACASTQRGLPPELEPRLAGHLSFLASDALAGRETGTSGGDVTAHYVASSLAALGLEPAGDDGSFLQAYPLTRSQLDADACRLVVSGGTPLTLGDDFVPRGGAGAGYELSAEAVFVGYGVAGEEAGQDPYTGLDVDGRLALAFIGSQRGTDDLPPISWSAQQALAQEHGAVGLVLLALDDDRASRQTLGWVRRSLDHASLELGMPEEGDEVFPRVYLAPEAATSLLAAGGLDLAAEHGARAQDAYLPGAALPGVTLDLACAVQVDVITAHNVAAVLRGSDPDRAHEALVLSAHMDHVGVADDGDVFNGADDNASGTTALLMAAELLAARDTAPERSVLFLAVSGEEKGLLGSEWWVDHPTWPLEDVVANVNADMVGRNDPGSIGVTPSPEHEAYNTLVQRAIALGPAFDLDVRFTAGLGDFERMVDVYYHRSDHANFSEVGIPVVFFFAGEHGDYHRVSDTYDKIDLDKVGRVSALVAELLSQVADAPGRPRDLAPEGDAPAG